jgi:MFS family permease
MAMTSANPAENEFQGAALRSLLGGALAVSVGFSSLVIFSFSVLLKPVSEAFGWGRGEASLAFSIGALTVALMSPLLGKLVDRRGAIPVALVCTAVYTLSFASLGFLNGALWHWYGSYFLLGLAGNGTTQLPYAKVVCGWYERHRGLALALMMLGVGASAVAVPLVVQRLLELVGIQGTYFALASAAGVVALPALLFLVRENPIHRSGTLSTSPHSSAAPIAPAREDRAYPGMRRLAPFASFFLLSLGANGCMAHLSAFLTDKQFAAADAARAVAAMGAMVLAGRVLAGWLLDRFSPNRVAAGLFGAALAGILVLLTGQSLPTLSAGAALVGLAMGAEADVMPYMVSRMFPLARFTEMYGFAFTAFAVGGAIGPALMGAGFDRMGNYQLMLAVMAACAAAATALIALCTIQPGASQAVRVPFPETEETQV